MYKIALSSTQAGGAVSAPPAPDYYGSRYYRHHIQAEVKTTSTGAPATATAGTLSVRGRAPGATTYQELGVITLAAPNPAVFDGYYDSIQAVSTGFDADKTWTLYIASGE